MSDTITAISESTGGCRLTGVSIDNLETKSEPMLASKERYIRRVFCLRTAPPWLSGRACPWYSQMRSKEDKVASSILAGGFQFS